MACVFFRRVVMEAIVELNDPELYRRRAAEAARNAEKARAPEIRDFHAKLAERYEDALREATTGRRKILSVRH